MSEAAYTFIVKTEPVEEDAAMEFEFPKRIKSEPLFTDIPESNPISDVKGAEVAPMVTIPGSEQETSKMEPYSSATIVKEELIIEDSNESLVESPDEEFGEEDESDNSKISSDDKKVLFCDECNKSFTCKRTHNSHRLRHFYIKTRKFACSTCDRPFSSRSDLNRHVQTMHTEDGARSKAANRTWQCHLCPVLCDSNKSYRSHLSSHEDQLQSMFRCEFCNCCFANQESLRDHVENGQCSKLVKQKRGTPASADKPNIYRCPECPKTFLDRSLCNRHIRRHESMKNGTFQCNECGKCYGRDTELRKHKLVHEKHLNVSSEDVQVITCDECNKSFTNKLSFNSHRLRHINSNKFKCSFCDRPFSSRTDLNRHVQIVHIQNSARSKAANRTWQCHLCPMLLDSNDSYRSHLLSHEEQLLSMFRCEFCSRCFANQESLQDHVESGQCSKFPKQILEEDNGLFKCCECNETFTLKRSCVQHTKRHFALRNKTFQCATCGSVHGTNVELVRHARVHGETLQSSKKEKPSSANKPNLYRCSECPKTFLDRTGCERHIKRHEAVKNGTFQCNECGKCYGRDTELRKHKLAHEKQREKQAAS